MTEQKEPVIAQHREIVLSSNSLEQTVITNRKVHTKLIEKEKNICCDLRNFGLQHSWWNAVEQQLGQQCQFNVNLLYNIFVLVHYHAVALHLSKASPMPLLRHVIGKS